MSAIAGVLLLLASVFGAVFGALFFRNPRNSRWVRSDSISDLAALVLVGLFAFGIANIATYAFTLPHSIAWVITGGAVVGSLALGWALWRGLGGSERLAAFDEEADRVARAARLGRMAEARPASGPRLSEMEPPSQPAGSGGGARRKRAA